MRTLALPYHLGGLVMYFDHERAKLSHFGGSGAAKIGNPVKSILAAR